VIRHQLAQTRFLESGFNIELCWRKPFHRLSEQAAGGAAPQAARCI
jgi:hypothetical protein